VQCIVEGTRSHLTPEPVGRRGQDLGHGEEIIRGLA
jgi:hypothetical protein